MDALTYPVWHDSAIQQTAFGTAPAHAEVDVAIVGAGLSGLWTAYYLSSAEPSLRIAILEARHVGFGASGRNGGWCSGYFPLTVSELASVYGRDAALLAYQESFATLPEVEQVLRREGIECGWHQGGTVQSASTALQAERLQSLLKQQHANGLGAGDAEWLPSSRVSEHISVAETHGAIYSRHCATLNPFQLVNGLARVLDQRGVTIWQNTAVQAIDNGVVTPQSWTCGCQASGASHRGLFTFDCPDQTTHRAAVFTDGGYRAAQSSDASGNWLAQPGHI